MAQYISMKKYNILALALVVVLSLFFVYYAVEAASTVGTNLSTTGTFSTTTASLSASLEVATGASLSGNLQFGGSGTHTLGVNSGSGALTINAFTLGGAVTGGSQDITGLAAIGAVNASLSTNFEAVGYASISGALQFGGSGTHTIGVNSGSGALTINAFTLGGAVTGGSQDITGLAAIGAVNASLSTNFEAVGYASISGALQFGGSGTHTIGVNSGSGALTINAFTLGGAVTGGSQDITGLAAIGAVNASLSTNFEAVGYASISGALQFGGSGTHTIGVNSGSGALTINAFTLGGAVTGNSQNLTGIAGFGSLTASISNGFEAGSYASASKLIIGGQLASISTGARYTAEFSSGSTTASTSINFGGAGATLGTCLQLKDSLGNNVYLRIIGGASATGATNLVSVSLTSCR